MKIGERIKARRMEIGWTQEEVANKMGYTNRATVSKIEAGVNDITYSKILRFAEVLGTSVEYLVGIADAGGYDTSAGRDVVEHQDVQYEK